MKGRTFDGQDGLHTTIDPSCSDTISDDAMAQSKYKIFFSHVGAKKDFVDHLCQALEEHCPYPFYDGGVESLPEGKSCLGLILKVVQQCQLFVVVISEEYFMSKWPMIELNAFVQAKKGVQANLNQRCILPIFYGLSLIELKDEERRQRWFGRWETFAREDPNGLINLDDWKYALDWLTMSKGLPLGEDFDQVVGYEKEIVSHICKTLSSKTLDSSDTINDDAMVQSKYKIFFSHVGAKKDFVDHLCQALEEHCPYPFYDGGVESLPKGKNCLGLILKVVQQCQLFVVVISEEYFMSKWPMIELNAFVQAKKGVQANLNQRCILPIFYGLSLIELKDEERRQRWFGRWETFAREDPNGLINLDDWKYALDWLTMSKGLPLGEDFNQVVGYEKEIVSHICKTLSSKTLDSSHSINDDAMVQSKYKIFFSHVGAKKDFVDYLCQALEEHCPYPFYDGGVESLPKGKNCLGLILKVVQQCQLFVVVISEEYFMSKWPMIELNAFVQAKKGVQANLNQRCILPIFYGLSLIELKDEERRQRWFGRWETFAREDPNGLINLDDWKYALDWLTMSKGLPFGEDSNQVVGYENDIVSYIGKLLDANIKWKDSDVPESGHEVAIEKMKHMDNVLSPDSLLKAAMTEFARLSDPILLTFPCNDLNPVRLEDKDLESLQPKQHLSINIIDFYTKYLVKEVLSNKDKDHFFFFNCSFFISTFGTKTSSIEIDYDKARQWIQGVNLFEKDYIFIPIHKREKWSLIIIYHLNNLTRFPTDAHYRSPCIFHLYSVDGKHDDLEGDIRSFIFKSWIEIHQNSDILQALFRMKYIEAKVPQEDNGYDSGIYLLDYVESFIFTSTSPNFNFGAEQGKLHFPCWDTSKVVAKRKHIQNLILKLSGMTQLQGTLRLHSSDILAWLQLKATSKRHIEDEQNNDLTMVNGEDAMSKHGNHQTQHVIILNEHQPFHIMETPTLLGEQPKLAQIEEIKRVCHTEESLLQEDINTSILHKKSETRRSRNWSATETSVLLRCIVDFGQFPQGKNAMCWDFIVGEVNKVCGTTHTKMQCQYRFDTLSKAFKQIDKFCRMNAKEFSEITEKELCEIKLATYLTREWYTLIAQHYAYKKCGKRPFGCPTSTIVENQIEAPTYCPSSPQIDIDNSLCNTSEFQSEILPETLALNLNNRHNETLVPKSSFTAPPSRPLVQQKKSKSNEDEMKGIYRRAIKDVDGGLLRFKYEPRFKPPREKNSLKDGFITNNMLSLGSYQTLQEAIDVRQIAAYYYGRSEAWLDLGNDTHFLIPDCDLVESQSLCGKDKMIWVQRKVKEVFASFQMEKARLNLLKKEEQFPLANPHSKMKRS